MLGAMVVVTAVAVEYRVQRVVGDLILLRLACCTYTLPNDNTLDKYNCWPVKMSFTHPLFQRRPHRY